MISLVVILFFIFASGIHFSFEYTDDWSYWGKNGPDHWPGICLTGKKQSPINIISNDTVVTNVQSLKLINYNSAYKGILTNTGHTVRIALPGVPMTLKGGGLMSTYVFEQMHFHWNSEHTIDGKREALELHLVHNTNDYHNGSTVVAVLFEISVKDNPDLSAILEAAKRVSPWIGPNDTPIDGEIIPSKFLPEDYSSFYRYEGSMTTPDCMELVTWFILENKLTVSESQLRVFRNVMSSNGSLSFNYRPLQKLGLRNVYHRLSDYSGASTMSQKNTVYLSILAAIVSMLLHVS